MTDDIDEMGPIDYIVLEWPERPADRRGRAADHRRPRPRDHPDPRHRVPGEGRGRQRSRASTSATLDGDGGGLADFEGASTGLIGQDDLDEAAEVLEPGTFGRGARVGEPLGGADRHRDAALRRPARRHRAHPGPSHPRALDALEATRLTKGARPCPDCSAASPAPPSSPAPRRPSATASRGARPGAGAPRTAAEHASRAAVRRAAPPRARRAGGRPDGPAASELAQLKTQGVLTEEEFAAAKAKILGT